MAASFVHFTILLTMPLANWSVTGTLAQPGVLIALVKAGQLTSQDQGIILVLVITAPHRDLFQSKQEG